MLETMASIPKDLLLHFFYGTMILYILKILVKNNVAIIILISIAIGKEYYDNIFSLYDIIATLIPIVISQRSK
mgnify:CR=1 FL=1|tara:strand:+ start:944 stop:1162 length:219 start_codon:yes stop_codon:yes gene_type:complete